MVKVGQIRKWNATGECFEVKHFDKMLLIPTEENSTLVQPVAITLKQFEILNDVLWEIQENRIYQGDDLIALEELQDMFSYDNYKKFREKV